MNRRGSVGGLAAAHVFFAAIVAGLTMVALWVGYPNVSGLFSIYAVGAVILFEMASRFQRGNVAPRFWRIAGGYAVLIGLASFYLLTDAYVLEQAHRAYPAGLGWFTAVLLSVGGLALVMSLRQPDRMDMFVLEPRFTGNGIGLFVAAVSLQLMVMTAITPLTFTITAFRLTCLATSLWFVVFGALLRYWELIVIASAFVLLNVLTAYLDLLWPYRESGVFLAGAVLLAAATIVATGIWARWLFRRQQASLTVR